MVTTIGKCSLCGGDVQIQSWHQPDATVAHCADCGAARDMCHPVIAMRPKTPPPTVVEVTRVP